MTQSRKASAVETATHFIAGLSISLATQVFIFPFYNIHVSIQTNVEITAWFALIGIARGYVIRRFFNRMSNQRKQDERHA